MEQPKISIVLISAGAILQGCLDAICAQNYPASKLELIVHRMETQKYHEHLLFNKYENCHRNRNKARERALASEAEYFLFVDDDIVLPGDAVTKFAFHAVEREGTVNIPKSMSSMFPGMDRKVSRKEVVGGYYPILGTNKYVCGRWVADNTFFNFNRIHTGLIRTDCVGLGCAFVSRRVLEAVQFEAGTEMRCQDAATGDEIILGECGMFGNRVDELGVRMYMDGNIVCEHLVRPKAERMSFGPLAGGESFAADEEREKQCVQG